MRITLKNLHEATAQQVFDQVALHMLAQNEKSLSPDGQCLYRNGEGLCCAAGSLIAEDEYEEDMEGGTWEALVTEHGVTAVHSMLICDLQSIHDACDAAKA